MSKSMKFVIRTHSFDDRVGGIIALHLLCRRLVDAGQEAILWPIDRPTLEPLQRPRSVLGWLRYHLTGRRKVFNHGPFLTKRAGFNDLRNAVVVYPEVTAGNPLHARHVVRWLLHKPGFHTGRVEFGERDLLFAYQDAFDESARPAQRGGRLTLIWQNEAYVDRGRADRSGSAYLVKKGTGRPLVHDLSNSILVDDLSHAEKADVFNRVQYFYTYDPYTLYSRYAAICGCIPVIIPPPGLSKQAWVAREEERYGLAYGTEERPWAVATRDLLLKRIVEEQVEERLMVQNFISRCREHFG
jgi:hypothetical protein